MSELTLKETVVIEKALSELDLTKVIEYSKKIDGFTKGLNTMLAPIVLKEFIQAFDETSMLLSKAVRLEMKAQESLKHAEGVAFLENATDYCKEMNLKPTGEIRKHYVYIDEGVIEAKDTLAKCTAMTTFLKNKLQAFRLCHDDAKKIAYYADNNNSGYEGM